MVHVTPALHLTRDSSARSLTVRGAIGAGSRRVLHREESTAEAFRAPATVYGKEPDGMDAVRQRSGIHEPGCAVAVGVRVARKVRRDVGTTVAEHHRKERAGVDADEDVSIRD